MGCWATASWHGGRRPRPRAEGLDSDSGQSGQDLGMDELDPGQQVATVAGARRGLECAVEVVHGGQQFLGQLIRRAPGRRRLAGRPFAVVLEVGLGPLGQLQILVSLLGPGRQLLQIVGSTWPRDPLTARPRCPEQLALRRAGAAGAAGSAYWRRSGALLLLLGRGAIHGRGGRVATVFHRLTRPRSRPRRRPRPPPRRRRRWLGASAPSVAAVARPPPAPGPAGTWPRRPCGRRTEASRSCC